MDQSRANELLREERARVENLLNSSDADAHLDRDGANEAGDMADPAESLVREGTDDAIIASLRDRLATIERAEQRLAAGTYGLSIQSGVPIPDERLEADPAAELTVDEALALDQ